MRLIDLMQGAYAQAALRQTRATPLDAPRGSCDVEVTGITANSQDVGAGFIFAALPGQTRDGRDYIADAVSQGAAAILAPPGTHWPAGVPPRPVIFDAQPRRRLAIMAASLAGAQPSRIAAVTGTNGKTSTADFLRQLWSFGGHPAASLGTLGLIAPGFPQGAGLTTPDPVSIAQTMAALARAGIQHAAVEASSHGLDQFRLDGLRLSAAAITNLTRDHLDYHGSMEAYRAAKLRLFTELLPAGAPAVAAMALDEETRNQLAYVALQRGLNYGTVGEGGNLIQLHRAAPLPDGQMLDLSVAGRRFEVKLALPGRFQADNALLAAAILLLQGDSAVFDRLPLLVGVRGRMELAATLPNGAAVYVDYAHTPDAISRVLSALRPHTAGKLAIVFGAGGDRDRGKRPLMAEAARLGADHVIVTDDNPRTEAAAAIRAEVMTGAPDAVEVGGREAAIAVGLALLGPGDVMVVAGKGHEQGQIVGREVLPFDDADVVRRLVGWLPA
ncbi:UDP-N-acetylmuramoyl-L-alanyl-D-glutamate--2,6-diaminopimelate ligase [Acidisoma silvae]|uniref:UDP-N-acetylmuramoyl-L-alanyl-D-glutamate--2,6-diaminopimelate ligase n=1 Tax=Acidisoma silvae TaxID=2802396 RepID=A0A963YPC0_9PROT|nr:UDP-N-acetylmuramoyl-L-alanyl-D-glutamate--2,6-diaminopimelate ligase [Acidisoma silvae]MCB8874570.1 UDP-N-acetylmuramoyl-L-alanyl-D-glutamate--2,6-diaminopimelate ligase [Acidisoma silvae]